MSAIGPPIGRVVAPPFGHPMRHVARKRRYPSNLAHLWYARDYPGAGTTMRSRRGPDYSGVIVGALGVSAGRMEFDANAVAALQGPTGVRQFPTETNLAVNGTDYANWTVTGVGTTKGASGIHLVDATNTETAKLSIPAVASGRAYLLSMNISANPGPSALRLNGALRGADSTITVGSGNIVYPIITKEAAITTKQLWLYVSGGTFVDYTVDKLIEAPNYGKVASAKLCITFDDGWDSQYTRAFAYMQTKGVQGTAYLITNAVGTAGKITAANADEMYAAGWCMANHTDDHSYMGAFTKEQAKARIQAGIDWLSARGYARGLKHFGYPGGQYNDAVVQAVFECGCDTARTINDGANGYIVPELFKLNTRNIAGGAYTLAQGKAFIDSAITNKSVIPFMFHRIVDTAGEVGAEGMEILYSDFCELIDYAVASGIDIVTMDELYGSMTISNPYVQESPAACTVAALVVPGATSALISADTNILAVRNAITDVLYFSSGGKIKASDGTNTVEVSVADGWDGTYPIAVATRTNSAGTQMQVGYRKYSTAGQPTDAAWTWGGLGTFKGTFGPVELLLFRDNAISQGMKGVEIWNKSASEAEIDKWIGRAF